MQASLLGIGEPELPKFDRWHVAIADAVTWLTSLPSASVDLVITDPAYESLEKHRAVGTTTRLTADWFPIFRNDRFEPLLREMFRVLAKDAHAYVLCDQETMFVLRPIAERVGFKWWKGIVWDKELMGTGYHYRAQHEMVCFLEKGHRNLASKSIPDVLRVKRIGAAARSYPTEKPVELLEILVQQSSKPGEIVIDPFTGSGSTGAAALKHGRRFLGCDVQERAALLAANRLASSIPDSGPRARIASEAVEKHQEVTANEGK